MLKKSMAPSFSRLLLPTIPGIAGFRSTHTGYVALFSALADSMERTIAEHGGKNMATTCSIYELTLKSGEVCLRQVLDDTGEQVDHVHQLWY
jgi:hypothetical protein